MSDGDTVWIVGMMGVGKSTVARALARRLGRPWVDTDAMVEDMAKQSISEIFSREGEPAFRRLERRAIESVAGTPVIAALGGGAIAQAGAAGRLRESGVIVALRARPETLLERIGAAENRPLLAGLDREQRLERVRHLIEERNPYYSRAQLRVDTDGLGPDEVAEAVLQALANGGVAS